MHAQTLETDYLIIGAGAVGMAFADVLLSETKAHITLVDLHAQPGGHWNDAYPFVTLHQPSAFYGVSSRELGRGQIDEIGLNKGLFELASGHEVAAYFDAVMRERFLPSGRVRYLPRTEHLGDGRCRSIVSGKEAQISARNKVVDATYLKTSVPSTHTPSFSIDAAATLIPINELVKLDRTPAGYNVIGGGKTGIDACLWLLENGVDPEQIEWVMPRDAWLINRGNTQPDKRFFAATMGAQAAQMEAIAVATSLTDLFARLEAASVLLRIDPAVQPKMFHAATVSQAELAQLRRIRNIVRLGRVQHLGSECVTFEHGQRPTTIDHVHVDCSASAISNLAPKPVFAGAVITPQTIRSYQPAFSAALIAHVEANYRDEGLKNELCSVVPLPNQVEDWPAMTAAFMTNQYRWSQEPGLRDWLLENRLDGFSKLAASVGDNDSAHRAILQRLRDHAMPAMANLQKLMAQMETQHA